MHCATSEATVLALGIVISLGLTSTAAAAQAPCADEAQAVVVLEFVGEAWTDAFAEQVQMELTVALSSQEILVCDPAALAGRAPTATLALTARSELPRVSVTIEVDDAVTQKRVARDIDLSAFTEDSRALALAVASDELLRASWVELVMEDAPPPTQPVPRQVQRAVSHEIEAAGPARTTMGLRFTTRAFSDGQVLLGGDLWLARRLTERLSLELSVGGAGGLSESSVQGTVESTAIGGALDLFFHPVNGEVVVFGGLIGVWVAQVTFEGSPSAGAVGRTQWGIAAYANAAAALEVLLGPAVFRLTLGVGAPLSQVVATSDDGTELTGVGGVGLVGNAGVGVRF